jgi:hypothetical protein
MRSARTEEQRTLEAMHYRCVVPAYSDPPEECYAALAVTSGADHFDTSNFHGRHITHQLIREALPPARRLAQGSMAGARFRFANSSRFGGAKGAG